MGELSDEMAAALKGGKPWKKFNGIAIKALGLREDVSLAWQQLLSCQIGEESGTLLMTFVDPTVDYGGKGIEHSRQNDRQTSRPPASFRPPPIFGPPATGVVPRPPATFQASKAYLDRRTAALEGEIAELEGRLRKKRQRRKK